MIAPFSLAELRGFYLFCSFAFRGLPNRHNLCQSVTVNKTGSLQMWNWIKDIAAATTLITLLYCMLMWGYILEGLF